jgi:hypothetical protein
MGEVLLIVEHDAARGVAMADQLAQRRWRPIDGVPAAYACYFENGFIEEVRQIVSEDVHACAAHVELARWHAVHAWSAEPHRVLDSSHRVAPAPRAPADVWCDGDAPVGPVADALACLGAATGPARRAWGAALEARHWRRIEGVPSAWSHAYDLAMFEPLEPLVARDLGDAACEAGLVAWRAAWTHSTWERTLLDGPRGPRPARSLPWDPTR